MPSASIPFTISTLEAHLLPSPVWPLLTSALSLFARLQQFSAQLQDDASRALRIHNERRGEMRNLGVVEKVQVENGLLNEMGERRLEAVREREGMFVASLELRKHHVAAIITSGFQFSAQQTQQLINTYFPDISPEDEGSWTSSAHRFIKCMSRAQAKELLKYRRTVMGWYGDAKKMDEDGHPHMRWEDLYSGQKDRGKAQLVQLTTEMIREARAVWADFQDFRAIVANDGSYNHNAWEREMKMKRKGAAGAVQSEMSVKDRRHTLGALPRPEQERPKPIQAGPSSSPRMKRPPRSLTSLSPSSSSSSAFTPRFLSRPHSRPFAFGSSPINPSPLTAYAQTLSTSSEVEPSKATVSGTLEVAPEVGRASAAAAVPRPESVVGSSRPLSGSSTTAGGVKRVHKRPRQSYPLTGPDYTTKKLKPLRWDGREVS